jgi:uncharacterized membrane protein
MIGLRQMLKKCMLPLVLLITGLFLTAAYAPSLALAANSTAKNAIQQGACEASGQSADCNPDSSTTDIDSTIKSVINILSVVVGIVAVIMIIVGGFRYITSAGDSTKVTSAKNTILYAIIGLIIVAMAQLIVRFVLFHTTNPSSGATQSGNQNQGSTTPPGDVVHHE